VAELKTKPTSQSVARFLNGIAEPSTRKDCATLVRIMKHATKAKPKMWGRSIVGFGTYHYRYASGREGDWFLVGFSPRKQNLTVYVMAGFNRYGALMRKLGKHKTGKSCLYLKTLDDVDVGVLTELVERSVKHVAKVHG